VPGLSDPGPGFSLAVDVTVTVTVLAGMTICFKSAVLLAIASLLPATS
jgi:hypothetical protein